MEGEDVRARATEEFDRSVGGRAVARDLIGYLSNSQGVVSIVVSARVGGSTRGPDDIQGDPELEREFERVMNRRHIKWQVRLVAEFSDPPIQSVEAEVRRWSTHCTIIGSDYRSVAGEHREIDGILTSHRRPLSRFNLLLGSLAGLITILAFVLAHAHL